MRSCLPALSSPPPQTDTKTTITKATVRDYLGPSPFAAPDALALGPSDMAITSFIQPPPFLEADPPDKGFVTAADETDEVTEVLFWNQKEHSGAYSIFDFGSESISPQLYFDSGNNKKKAVVGSGKAAQNHAEPQAEASSVGAYKVPNRASGAVEECYDDEERAQVHLFGTVPRWFSVCFFLLFCTRSHCHC